jgi:hypothetical protein
MSTPPASQLEAALGKLPKEYRDRLIKAYLGLKVAFADGVFDACGLRAAKYAEVVLRLLQHELGQIPIPFGQKISNLQDECAKLEQLPKAIGSESLRIVIPRALTFLYTLRNKRGIGHVGGDIEANEIDAATAARLADWTLAELIRIYYAIPLEDAQSLLDAIVTRQLPQVWTVAGKKRVLNPKLTYQEQVLILLYGERDNGVVFEDLFEWVEHPRKDRFRSNVVRPLHESRLVEYDEETQVVILSPTGVKEVEDRLLATAASE